MDTDLQEFDELLASTEKSIIIMWSASWCNPCKRLKPLFYKMSEGNNNMLFVIIDIEENPTVTNKYGIRKIPTIKMFKNSEEVDTLTDNSEESLRAFVNKWSVPSV